MILTARGDVYAWGLNNKGQLGLGHFNNRKIPTLVTSISMSGRDSNIHKRTSSNSTSTNKLMTICVT